MSQTGYIAFLLLAAFVVYLIQKGELPVYFDFFFHNKA